MNDIDPSDTVFPVMFTAQLLKDRMNAQPFKPFRICMSDGKIFDITNHDMAFVKRNVIEIGVDVDPNGLAEFFIECAILHITRVEDLPSINAA